MSKDANKSKAFRTGDLVLVDAPVHDDALPEHRMGLIVETVGDKKDQQILMFTNGKFLKFHNSQLTRLSRL